VSGTPDRETTNHNLFNASGIYFVLPGSLAREHFDAVMGVLSDAAGRTIAVADVERHWTALRERLTGRSRWDTLVPRVVVTRDDPKRIAKLHAAAQSLANILKFRPYQSVEIDGLTCSVEVFNPANELELDGWPSHQVVLALLLSPAGEKGRTPLRELSSSSSFYDVVRQLDAVLRPERVCGTFSLASMVYALLDGRMASAERFWKILYPLTVVERSANGPLLDQLRAICRVVIEWPGNRVLVQPREGLDPVMGAEYERAAEALGLKAWSDYVEGGDLPDLAEATASSWPTQVRANGTSPSSIELVGSGQAALVRQALYQVQAAQLLQQLGHTVSSFQAPLIGARVRITVPVVLARSPGPDACAYTQCEPWTPDRIAALQIWLNDLRKESDSDVIVVAREHSDAVATLPDVAKFVHFPYEGLPALTG
jgi:hypothetical protein